MSELITELRFGQDVKALVVLGSLSKVNDLVMHILRPFESDITVFISGKNVEESPDQSVSNATGMTLNIEQWEANNAVVIVITSVDNFEIQALDLVLNQNGKVLVSQSKNYVPTACINDSDPKPGCVPADPAWVSRIADIQAEYIAAKSDVIAYSTVPLYSKKECYNTSCSSGFVVCEAMRWTFPQCDMSIFNTGAFGDLIQPGNITKKDIDTLLPFTNYIHIVEMTGVTLIDFLRNGVSKIWPPADGFDGQGRFPQMSGVVMEYFLNTTSDYRILNVEQLLRNGSRKAIEARQVYSVCLNDYIAEGGDGYLFRDEYISHTATGKQSECGFVFAFSPIYIFMYIMIHITSRRSYEYCYYRVLGE
jgi:2',3'-cyclic-nucleotide 2'-phosphodiesterase (5'-nucleotidase family)